MIRVLFLLVDKFFLGAKTFNVSRREYRNRMAKIGLIENYDYFREAYDQGRIGRRHYRMCVGLDGLKRQG